MIISYEKTNFNIVSMTSWEKLLMVVFVTVLGCSLFDTTRASEPVTFYVSVNGSDLNKGTREEPFATLEAAKNAVRKFKKKDIRLTNPVEVIIGGGIYYLDETLELKPEDSGTKNAGITWRSAENEKVVLSGGRAIDGEWKKTSDGKLWVVDLPQTKGWERENTKPEGYQKKPNNPYHFRQLFIGICFYKID